MLPVLPTQATIMVRRLSGWKSSRPIYTLIHTTTKVSCNYRVRLCTVDQLATVKRSRSTQRLWRIDATSLKTTSGYLQIRKAPSTLQACSSIQMMMKLLRRLAHFTKPNSPRLSTSNKVNVIGTARPMPPLSCQTTPVLHFRSSRRSAFWWVVSIVTTRQKPCLIASTVRLR